MTLGVHINYADEYIEDMKTGWVLTGRSLIGDRLYFAHSDHTCLHHMRGWVTDTEEHYGYCLLDKGHRGRHATVAFGCDGCGKMRRGYPYRSNDEVAMCFMCMVVDRRW